MEGQEENGVRDGDSGEGMVLGADIDESDIGFGDRGKKGGGEQLCWQVGLTLEEKCIYHDGRRHIQGALAHWRGVSMC